MASSSGRTRLVLRGSFDEGVRQGDGVSVAELLGSRPQPQMVQPVMVEKPTTQPVGPVVVADPPQQYEQPQTRKHMVEFIRGTKLTHGEFEITVDPDGNESLGSTKEND